MNPPVFLALTSHGNAPYLMVTRLARALGNARVLIPDYYGNTQHKILKEELPECQHLVYLSRELGEILSPLLLDGSQNSSFAEFGSRVANPANPQGVDQIENALGKLLVDGIPATSLDGLDKTRYLLKDFTGVLNTTLPLRVNIPLHVFFFTAWMSELYGTLPPGDDSTASRKTHEMLAPYASLWRRAEAAYTHAFIPRIHAFSYREQPIPRVIHTPPLAFRRPVIQQLTGKSILFIPSGTRTDVHHLNRLAVETTADYQRLVLGHLRDHGDFPSHVFKRVNASSFGDEHLTGVIARGGWGTIWECLANEKPLAVPRLTFADDPEMGHTQAAIMHTGLGRIMDDSILPFLADESLSEIKQRIQQIRAEDKRHFASWADDGIGFIAHTLRSHMPELSVN
jgi:hypothetical protein